MYHSQKRSCVWQTVMGKTKSLVQIQHCYLWPAADHSLENVLVKHAKSFGQCAIVVMVINRVKLSQPSYYYRKSGKEERQFG